MRLGICRQRVPPICRYVRRICRTVALHCVRCATAVSSTHMPHHAWRMQVPQHVLACRNRTGLQYAENMRRSPFDGRLHCSVALHCWQWVSKLTPEKRLEVPKVNHFKRMFSSECSSSAFYVSVLLPQAITQVAVPNHMLHLIFTYFSMPVWFI